jgi:hypothetical protein
MQKRFNLIKSKLRFREITLFLQSIVFVTTDAAFAFVPSKELDISKPILKLQIYN